MPYNSRIAQIMLNSIIDKMFFFFLSIGFIFLMAMFTVAGIFLYQGVSSLFLDKFSDNQVEKSLFELIKGIEFIFIAAVPYLLILSVYKYFRVMFPKELSQDQGNTSDKSYALAQKTREEILFVRSLIVSIFIAVVITHLLSHIFKAIVLGQLDLPLAGVSLVLLIVLIFYYAQIERAMPPNINYQRPNPEEIR